MGKYAVLHNVQRLVEDHDRAKRIGAHLHNHGLWLPRNGQVDTNIIYFGLPDDGSATVDKDEVCSRLDSEYGVMITGGYSQGGRLFRIVTHMDVNDEDIEYAAKAIVKVCVR